MNSQQMQIAKKIRDTIKIMDDRKLPYTYAEVSTLVHQLNGDMGSINTFIDNYEKHITKNSACSRCGCLVELEEDTELKKEYPYYCPECDENLYSFETKES
jgi:formamidopyrimidine-DNA glycosylase